MIRKLGYHFKLAEHPAGSELALMITYASWPGPGNHGKPWKTTYKPSKTQGENLLPDMVVPRSRHGMRVRSSGRGRLDATCRDSLTNPPADWTCRLEDIPQIVGLQEAFDLLVRLIGQRRSSY